MASHVLRASFWFSFAGLRLLDPSRDSGGGASAARTTVAVLKGVEGGYWVFTTSGGHIQVKETTDNPLRIGGLDIFGLSIDRTEAEWSAYQQ